MLSLLNRKPDRRIKVGVALQPQGVAVAMYHQDSDPPRLVCDFMPCTAADEIPSALLHLVDKHQLHGQHAVSLMNSEDYHVLQITSPPLTKAELRAAARWKIADLIPYPAEQAVIDVFEYPESGQKNAERLLYAIAAKATDVADMVQTLRDARLHIDAIDINEFALRNVLAASAADTASVMILHLTAQQGLLVFIKDGELYLTRRLDLGFADLCREDEELYNAVVLELQRSLDYFERQFAQALPSQLLIYPAEKISGELILHIHSHLDLAVEPLTLDKLVNIPVAGDERSVANGLLAVGAVLRESLGAAA